MTQERKQQVQYLLAQYIEGRISPRQEVLLFQLLDEEKDNQAWEDIIEELITAEPELTNYSPQDWTQVVESILKKRNRHGGKIVRINWKRWVAAASILLLVGVGAYYIFNKREKPQVAVEQKRFKNDVEPGHEGAILTLASGQKILLDSATNGTLATQGKSSIVKETGQITYKSEGAGNVVYNTMTTPRGRQYSLVLADGTKVWLNAESSITYPTSFTGKERKVTMTGEAYFEVAHNAGQPFVVERGDMNVRVLGTHFNVNAYDDEPSIRVTLLEGSVEVKRQTSNVKIIPGEQAVAGAKGPLVINRDADLDEVMAWKNGRFQFEGANIEQVMKQVARWYDVDVVYEGTPTTQHFRGGISRNVTASKVFEMLEKTEAVKFKIEGRKVTVTK